MVYPRSCDVCITNECECILKLAKVRSGLVPTFQRREKKLAVSFGLYNSPRLLDDAQKSRF